MNRTIVLAVLVSTAFSPLTSLAATTKTPVPPTGTELKIFSPNGDLVSSFRPFDKAGDAAGSVAVGDLGADGTSEIVVGAGSGNKPLVRVMRLDGSLIKEFSSYATGMKSGVNVAICDLNGDGTNDIVTGAMYGGGPQVREFSADGTYLKVHFFAYDEKLRTGVNVACGDVDGDGKAEIITGAGPEARLILKFLLLTAHLRQPKRSPIFQKNLAYMCSLATSTRTRRTKSWPHQ